MLEPYLIVPPPIPSAGLYYFTTDQAVKYEVRFGRKQRDLLCVTIVFGVINEEYEGEEYVVTNKGDVFRVMNTIQKIVEMFIEQNPNVRSYEFMGEPVGDEKLTEATKRIKLFLRYAHRTFGPEWDIRMLGNKVEIVKKSSHHLPDSTL